MAEQGGSPQQALGPEPTDAAESPAADPRPLTAALGPDLGVRQASGSTPGRVQTLSWPHVEELTEGAEKLGEGGYANVYGGTFQGMRVAVKIFKTFKDPSGLCDVSDAESFHTEVQTLSGLQHKNIVSLVGYARQGSQMALVYPRADRSLHQHLPSPDFGWLQRLQCALGIVQGVAHLHQLQPPVMHRDLKPQNVLLFRDGSSLVPRLSDFGIARRSPELLAHTHVKSQPLGTDGYVSERTRETGEYSFASDAYAVGIILLQLLLGVDYTWNTSWQCSIKEMDVSDSTLREPFPGEIAQRLFGLGQACVKDGRRDRKTRRTQDAPGMPSVEHSLQRIIEDCTRGCVLCLRAKLQLPCGHLCRRCATDLLVIDSEGGGAAQCPSCRKGFDRSALPLDGDPGPSAPPGGEG